MAGKMGFAQKTQFLNIVCNIKIQVSEQTDLSVDQEQIQAILL